MNYIINNIINNKYKLNLNIFITYKFLINIEKYYNKLYYFSFLSTI